MEERARIDFGILEGLRGIAAFVVVLNHARGSLFVRGQVYLQAPDAGWADWLVVTVLQITSIGPQAVIVFFVLSGFSIAHAVERSGAASSFYWRRLLRLYPPYLGGLALAGLAYLIFSRWPVAGVPPPGSTLGDAGQTLLKVLSDHPGSFSFVPQYWSLTHEVLFYALAPLVAAAGWRLHFAGISAAAYVVGLAVPHADSTLLRFIFDYSIYFAVGAVAYRHRASLARLAVSRRALTVLSVIAVVSLVAVMRFSERASFVLSGALSLLLIANFLEHRITGPLMAALGAMSYTLYVTHFAAIFLWAWGLNKVGMLPQIPSGSPWLWLTAIPFCLLVAWALYLLLERPAVRGLARLRSVTTVLPLA